MEYRLTIDRGNTAIKGALWAPDGSIAYAAKGDESLPAADMARTLMAHAPSGAKLAAVAFCSVVASEKESDIVSLRTLGCPVTDLTCDTPMPLSITYSTPHTLGADRIAAALGAIAVAGTDRPLLVSDLGTAVTYDFVQPGSIYAGGNIAPGIDLRLRALAAFTDALPAVAADGDAPLWGHDTATAMRSGACRGVLAELEYYHRAAGTDAIAVLTGGSARLLIDSGNITFDFIHDPYLVHKGLYSIIDK